MSRRRKEDRELWEQVKKSVKPLHSDRASAKFKQAVGEMHKPRPAPVRGPSRIVKPHVPEPAIRISLAPKPDRLDASTARKIAKGRLAIDGRIDLHGMTQVPRQAGHASGFHKSGLIHRSDDGGRGGISGQLGAGLL